MKKIIGFFTILLFCSSCINTVKKEWVEDKNDYKQWVFITFESIILNDTSVNYYYGQINNSAMERMYKNDLTGYVTIKNLRFINNSDKLEVYEDNSLVGTRTFRLKDVVRVDYLKQDPIFTYEENELDITAKKLRHKKK